MCGLQPSYRTYTGCTRRSSNDSGTITWFRLSDRIDQEACNSHQITIRIITRCANAPKDNHNSSCGNLIDLTPGDEEKLGFTRCRGECPACIAVAKAEESACVQTEYVRRPDF